MTADSFTSLSWTNKLWNKFELNSIKRQNLASSLFPWLEFYYQLQSEIFFLEFSRHSYFRQSVSGKTWLRWRFLKVPHFSIIKSWFFSMQHVLTEENPTLRRPLHIYLWEYNDVISTGVSESLKVWTTIISVSIYRLPLKDMRAPELQSKANFSQTVVLIG